jgi:urease accessory protein
VRALACPLNEMGGAAFRADLAGMRHETQYTRLFRS